MACSQGRMRSTVSKPVMKGETGMTMSNPLISPDRLLHLLDKPAKNLHQPARIRLFPDLDEPHRESGCDMISVTRQPTDPRSVERLRHMYRSVYLDRIQRTRSNRFNLLDLPHWTVNHQPVWLMDGFVTDLAFNLYGHVTRICLMSPTVIPVDEHGTMTDANPEPVDTHLWLHLNRMDFRPKTADSRCKPAGALFDLKLGDRLIFECALNLYGERNHRRVGVDRWTPYHRALEYGNRAGRIRRVPEHLRGNPPLLTVTDERRVATISEYDWHEYVDRLEREHGSIRMVAAGRAGGRLDLLQDWYPHL